MRPYYRVSGVFTVAELMEVHKSRETGKEQADAARGRSLANPKTAKGVAIAAKSPKAAGASVLSARDEVSEVTTAPKPRTPIGEGGKLCENFRTGCAHSA